MLLSVSIVLGLVATMGLVAVPFALNKHKNASAITSAMPSLAPRYWLISPFKVARLHRRVNGVIRIIESCAAINSHRVPPNHQVARFTADLIQEALVLDDQLVASSHMGRGIGRRLLDLIEPQIGHLEELAGRLAIMTGGSSRPGNASATALVAIDERLSSMEAAHHEIIHLETLLSSSHTETQRSMAQGHDLGSDQSNETQE